jgi:hypothetical protein
MIITVVPRPRNCRAILCIPQCCLQLLCRMLRLRSYHLAQRLYLVLTSVNQCRGTSIFLEDNEMRSRSALVGVNYSLVSSPREFKACDVDGTKPLTILASTYLVFAQVQEVYSSLQTRIRRVFNTKFSLRCSDIYINKTHYAYVMHSYDFIGNEARSPSFILFFQKIKYAFICFHP